MRSYLAVFAAAVLELPAGCDSPNSAATVERTWGQPGTESGNFVKPRGLAVDAARGRVYVADMSGRVQKFDLDGAFLASWKMPDTTLGTSEGMVVNAAGDLLVADTHYHRILRYRSSGKEAARPAEGTWKPLPGEHELAPDFIGAEGDAPGQFRFPVGIALDGAENLYVCEYGGNRVQKFDARGNYLLGWGSLGAAPGQFQRPSGLAIEKDGNVLVADACNHRIQRFTPDGKFVSAWGRQGTAEGELHYPYDVAVLPDGSIAVAENYNHRVQRFSPQGKPLGIVGRPGREPGEFNRPWCLAPGPSGVLYVTDTLNHRVQRLRYGSSQLPVASCQQQGTGN